LANGSWLNTSFGRDEKKVSCPAVPKIVSNVLNSGMSGAPEQGVSLLVVPELSVVVLDRGAVERAFAEIAFETTVLAVLVKGGTTERAMGGSPSLGTARQALLAGEASGVQVQYAHAGEEWWATFMAVQNAFRFVRVRRSGVPESSADAPKSPSKRR
jgi:hypothetical protein